MPELRYNRTFKNCMAAMAFCIILFGSVVAVLVAILLFHFFRGFIRGLSS